MTKSVLLPFEKLNNARDLGGMKCSDGRRIRKNKLIRSEHLISVSDSDKEALSALVDTVIDLRTRRETLDNPDIALTGVNNIHIPIIERLTPGVTPVDDPDKFLYIAMTSDPLLSKKYMCDMYGSFAFNDHSVSQYGLFIKHLAKARDKAVLYHCTAGKDRAGTASLIIETILGVPKDDISADYLMTNEYLKENIIRMTHEAKQSCGVTGKNADEALWYLFAAEIDYINAFYNAVDMRFGSFDAFIKNGLGLSENDIETLKNIYLE